MTFSALITIIGIVKWSDINVRWWTNQLSDILVSSRHLSSPLVSSRCLSFPLVSSRLLSSPIITTRFLSFPLVPLAHCTLQQNRQHTLGSLSFVALVTVIPSCKSLLICFTVNSLVELSISTHLSQLEVFKCWKLWV